MIPFMGETVFRAFNLVFIPMFLLYIYIYIYILNYKSHKRDFIKTSTVCFAFTAHQEVILNADEKLRKNARKS